MLNTALLATHEFIVLGPCQGGFQTLFPRDYVRDPLFTEDFRSEEIPENGFLIESSLYREILPMLDEQGILIAGTDDAIILDLGNGDMLVIENHEPIVEIIMIVDGERIEIDCFDDSELSLANSVAFMLEEMMTDEELNHKA